MKTIKKKTVSIISTQLQFINCVEYLKLEGYANNDVVFYARSNSRMKQLNLLLEQPCYSCVFNKVTRFSYTESRFLNYILSIWFLLIIDVLTFFNRYDVCIAGMYLFSAHRHLIRRTSSKKKEVQVVIVDDGTGTLRVGVERKREIENREPFIFYENKIIRALYNLHLNSYIPSHITFYTVYDIEILKNDSKIKQTYTYIKQHIQDFKVEPNLLTTGIIFLGQAIHDDVEMTVDMYNAYLRRVNKYFEGRQIVYYPHPEEVGSSWLAKDLSGVYNVIPNQFSVEIIALLINKPVIMAGFVTSALYNVNILNPLIEPVTFYIKDSDFLRPLVANDFSRCYTEFIERGIKVIYDY